MHFWISRSTTIVTTVLAWVHNKHANKMPRGLGPTIKYQSIRHSDTCPGSYFFSTASTTLKRYFFRVFTEIGSSLVLHRVRVFLQKISSCSSMTIHSSHLKTLFDLVSIMKFNVVCCGCPDTDDILPDSVVRTPVLLHNAALCPAASWQSSFACSVKTNISK